MGSGGFPGDGALEAELAALRTRAYGVDADIDADPDAVARLAVLEELHAAALARGGGDAAAPRADSARAGAASALRRETAGAGGGGAWWRRSRAGALMTGAAAVLAVGAVVGGWLWWTAPRPDVTLHRIDAAPSDQVLRLADYARRQLVIKTTLRAFEPVMGLEVWSARSVLGNDCLLVFEPSTDEFLAVGCAPPPAEPVAEIYDVPVEWEEEWVERFPTGTMVRFVQHGDTVDVWIHEGVSEEGMPRM